MTRVRPTTTHLTILPAEGVDARIYESAIRKAIEMVNADGGTIATLNEDRSAMVLRVRHVHPRLRPDPVRAAAAPDPAIEDESTTVLPAVQLWRYYRQGERLIGHTWMTGKPVIMSGDEVQGLPGNAAPADPPAAFHLAVPIFAPLPDEASPALEDTFITGVLTVYVTDPRWQFTQNHIRLLEAQAANIAQRLQLQRLERNEQSHRSLLSLLQELTSITPANNSLENFYETFFDRFYVALRGVMDIAAFAAVIAQAGTNGQGGSAGHPAEATLTYYAVVDDGHRFAPIRVLENQPAWWPWVRYGQTVRWLNDEDHVRFPHLQLREWGSHSYMDSQIYVPVKTSWGVVGALVVASNRMNVYTNEHVSLLEMAARFAGLTIENAQLRIARASPPAQLSGAESERARSLLINSLLSLNTTLDVNAIISALVEQASELARGQICGYMEYDRLQNDLVVRNIAHTKDHLYPEAIGQRIPVGNGRLRAAMEGQTQRLENLDEEYNRGDSIGRLLDRYNVQAMVIVPIIHHESVTGRDRVIGLLGIYSPEQQAYFSPGEIMNLEALARVAAAAIDNARTYAQLRELDKLKDEFVLTASHEFRTPMSAIQGFSWLIQRRHETMTPEQARHWANEIIRATEQLRDMMDTITESWRTQSVQLPPVQPVPVVVALNLALEILAAQLASSHHTTQAEIPETLWVMGEADRLRHVFSNLLSNAAKYSPENSRIQITAAVRSGADLAAQTRERGAQDDDEEPVVNVTAVSGPWAVISVHDEGQGINRNDQKRLFAKFVRLTLTTSVRGTGLGLYICRRYIESMGGEIWVESAPGQGSTFSFCLPLTAAVS